jgi:hypothetical protein
LDSSESTLHIPAGLLERVAGLGLNLHIAFTPPYVPPDKGNKKS